MSTQQQNSNSINNSSRVAPSSSSKTVAVPTSTSSAAATATSAVPAKNTNAKETPFLSKFMYTKESHSPGRDEAHIQMLEPEVTKAVTVSFSSLLPRTKNSNNKNSNAAATDHNNSKNGNDDDDDQRIPAANRNNDDITSFPVNAKLRGILQQWGFAIVADVYTPEQCQQLENLWAQDLLSTITPPTNEGQKQAQERSQILQHIKQNPVYNWPMDKLSLGAKFASDLGLPHGRLAWAVRTNDNVKKVFAAIFGDLDLCTGVDNVFFDNRVLTEDNDLRRTSTLWPHADQNLSIRPGGDHEIYQGVLYVMEANIDTSATVVWPQSHTAVYDSLMRSKDWSNGGHFCPLPRSRLEEFAQNARRVPVPAGALLLWNSKTVHQGYAGGPRLAIPVSMQSKALRPQAAFTSKIHLCRTGLPSSHWATIAKQHSLAKPNQPAREYPGDKSFLVEARAHLHMFKNGNPKSAIASEIMDVC